MFGLVAVTGAPTFPTVFSATLRALAESGNTGLSLSSSVIVRVAVPPVRPAALPLRITVSSALSTTSSSVGVNVKVAVPLRWSAGIVTVKFSTAA